MIGFNSVKSHNFKRKFKNYFQSLRCNAHPSVLKLFSYKNDIVLDPFNGAGTTTVVAKKAGCRYLSIDISEEYCSKRSDGTSFRTFALLYEIEQADLNVQQDFPGTGPF